MHMFIMLIIAFSTANYKLRTRKMTHQLGTVAYVLSVVIVSAMSAFEKLRRNTNM